MAEGNMASEAGVPWNGQAGHAWVAAQPLLDALFAPIETLIVDSIPRGTRDALDIGCGTGATTLAVAAALAPHGRCTGIDISEPMIAAARKRGEGVMQASFLCADATTHAFAPNSFDLFVSRFGVMFFDAPETAFANLRRAARPGAELRLVAWRPASENPFMTTAEEAAAPLIAGIESRSPDGPGQFGFGDPARVARILANGWRDVVLDPVDFECRMPEAELTRYFTTIGPLGRLLPAADPDTRARVTAAVRAAFERFVHGDTVRFTAACWMVRGRAG